MDGHRKCDVCLQPAETRLYQGLCPVCGKALTLGVLNRVEQLATRIEGIRSKRTFPFYRLIPLENILSELLCVGPKSKKVSQTYWSLLENLGNELTILHDLAIERIAAVGFPLIDEAISRMRDNRVAFSPGYDGVFGTVHIFSEAERSKLSTQRSLFAGFDIGTVANPPQMKNNPIQPQPSLQQNTIDSVDPVVRLNAEQQKAVDHTHGSLMIVAGPGTGKTRTLTHRMGRILQSGADISRIIAVTFTNKAAKEMQERLFAMLGESQPLPFVGTFHSLGYQILKDGNTDRALSILDEDGRKAIVQDVLVLNNQVGNGRRIKLEDLMKWIGLAKQKMLSFCEELDDICPPEQVDLFRRCYESYENILEIHHSVDFEDLIFKSVQLLENDVSIQENYKNRFTDIFIDEYQDINVSQYRLVRLLAGGQANLCVIGDPDQSIYGFRGSDLSCFKWFLGDYPQCQTVFLQKNYRSTQTILEISSQVIRHNPEPLATGQRLATYSNRTGDRKIQVLEMQSENAEAVAIGKTIEKMVGGIGFLSLDSGSVDVSDDSLNFGFSDFAVLFRTRNQAVPILKILEKAGIPCQVVDRRSVLDHLGLKSLLSIVKLMHGLGGYADIEAALKVMRPKLSSHLIKSLKRWAYQNQLCVEQAFIQTRRRLPIPPMGLSKQQQLYDFIHQIDILKNRLATCSLTDQIEYLSEKLGITEKFNDDIFFEKGFQQIVESAKGLFPKDVADFLATVALCRDTDTYDHRVEKVSLMTLHAAKGLEFPVVFISGCEDEWIPYRSENRSSDVQEERRLFYVALTRAKRYLFLSWAKNRRIHGKPRSRHVSPFIEDIDMIYKTNFGHDFKKAPQSQHKQLSLF
ncbi:3'-5' exonuclease [Desulfosarcina cetonica]